MKKTPRKAGTIRVTVMGVGGRGRPLTRTVDVGSSQWGSFFQIYGLGPAGSPLDPAELTPILASEVRSIVLIPSIAAVGKDKADRYFVVMLTWVPPSRAGMCLVAMDRSLLLSLVSELIREEVTRALDLIDDAANR